MGNATDKWYLSGTLGIGTAEPGKMLHIQGSSSGPLLNDSHDRPGLAITGSYPELDLFSEADNTNHGPTIRLGGYNNDKKDSFKQWVIGTSGRNSSFLDIGFSDKNDPNPHAGIRNHNGKTLFTILQNGNVGIGTTTPKGSLEVMQTFFPFFPVDPIILQPVLRDLKTVTLSGELTTGLRFFSQHNPNVSSGGVINSCDADGTVRPLTLQMNGGNVGIGTANPTHPLHVKTNWGFLALDSNTAGQDSGLRLMEGGAVKWHIWNSANDAKFYIARDGLPPIFAIDKIGNLSVSNDIAIGGKHAFRGNDSWLRLNQDGAFPNGVHTPGMMCPNSLNVGGRESWSTNPGSGNGWFAGSITYEGNLNKLDVAEGDAYARIRAHDLWFGHSTRRGSMGRALVDGGDKLIINYERDWQNVLIPGLDIISTREVKTNIKPLAEDVAFRIIRELNPVCYNHKRWPYELPRLGFIAEDVPDEIASEDHKAIRPDNIIAALTKVVQNQQLQIEALEKRVLSFEQ